MKAALAVTALFGGAVRSAHADEAADLPPQPGDRLVRMDDEGAPQPLKTADIPFASKPVRALPYAAGDALLRDGSRLGRVILMRFDPASLDAETRARSADGVLAYSAVCTHQGCLVTEVTETIDCACHFSKFSITDGSVVSGPASAPLAEQAITVDGDSIVLG